MNKFKTNVSLRYQTFTLWIIWFFMPFIRHIFFFTHKGHFKPSNKANRLLLPAHRIVEKLKCSSISAKAAVHDLPWVVFEEGNGCDKRQFVHAPSGKPMYMCVCFIFIREIMIAGRSEGTPGQNNCLLEYIFCAHSEKTQCSIFIYNDAENRLQSGRPIDRARSARHVCAAVIRQIQCAIFLFPVTFLCDLPGAQRTPWEPKSRKKKRRPWSVSSFLPTRPLHTSQRFVHVYENVRMRAAVVIAQRTFIITAPCVCCRRNYCCVPWCRKTRNRQTEK